METDPDTYSAAVSRGGRQKASPGRPGGYRRPGSARRRLVLCGATFGCGLELKTPGCIRVLRMTIRTCRDADLPNQVLSNQPLEAFARAVSQSMGLRRVTIH